MNDQEIVDAFFKAISARGVSTVLNVQRSVVSKWKEPARQPSIGKMIEVLRELKVIKVVLND